MWLYIISAIVVVLLSPILIGIFDYIRAVIGLKFYERQGLYVEYSPLGIFSMLSRHWPENSKTSNMERLKALSRKYRDKKAVAMKRIDAPGINVLFFTEDFCKDYIAKEDNFNKSAFDSQAVKGTYGFFFDNGHQYAVSRSIFVRAFAYERLSSFAINAADMIQREINKFIIKKGINKDAYTKVNIKDLFHIILEKVLNIFLLGQEEVEKLPTGESVYEAVHRMHDYLVSLRQSPLYLLIPALCFKYELIKPVREKVKLEKELMAHLNKLYRQREESGKFGDCAMDMIIQHNRQCKETGNMDEYMNEREFYGTINVFQFAGTDTSLNLVTNVLCQMASKPELQDIFEQINKQIFDEKGNIVKESIETNPNLNEWMMECLRICNPSTRISQRIAKKDCEINGIKIRAGDAVTLSITAMNFNEEFYPKPEIFDPQRFKNLKDKNLPRYQYIPFGMGKRICLGRGLGELFSKLILCLMCKSLQFRKPDDVEYYTFSATVNSELYPFFEVKTK